MHAQMHISTHIQTHNTGSGNPQAAQRESPVCGAEMGNSSRTHTAQVLTRHKADYRWAQVARICRANYRQGIIPARERTGDLQRVSSLSHLHKRNVHPKIFFPNSHKLKTIQMSIKIQMDKQRVVYPFIRILISDNMEWTIGTKNRSMYWVEWGLHKNICPCLSPLNLWM